MKKFVLSILLMLISCRLGFYHREMEYPAKKPATPVTMEKGPTKIHLQDYFLHPENIVSIEKHSHYSFVLDTMNYILTVTPAENFAPVENLRINFKDGYTDIPLFKSVKTDTVFSFPAHDSIKQIAFKSQITGWVPVPMKKERNKWVYRVSLPPGNYPYLFVVNGKEILDPGNPVKAANGLGGYNSLMSVGQALFRTAFISPEKYEKNQIVISTDKPILNALAYIDNRLVPPGKVKIHPKEIILKLPQKLHGRTDLRIYAYDSTGRTNDLLIPLKNGKPVMNPGELTRYDFHTQIMYFMMVDRFYDGYSTNNIPVQSDSVLPKVNYMGGDLQGIVKKLDEKYFQTLGVNTLWISPILKNPEGAYGHWPDPPTRFTGYHGYWPVSNMHIDYRFGDEKTFRELIEKAHQNNMNVLLDYVSNHVHKEHPVYKQHPDWFTSLYLPDGTLNLQKWDSHRLTTWFDTFLPTFDFSKDEPVEAMTDSALYWLSRYPLDGFRHDATKHIQLKFWRTLTRKIKSRVKRPVFQIGETYGSPELIGSYIHSGMLDAQFDFNLYDAEVRVFARTGENISRLAGELKQSLFFYGHHHLMGNMSGNQDRVRFISYASGDVRFDEDGKMAGWKRKITVSDTSAYYQLEKLHAFNMVIPGIPCIYYGDEIGMPGANDPDNRRMMRFKNWNRHEKTLFHNLRNLIQLRKTSMALLYGTTRVEVPQKNVLKITRKYFNEEIHIIFNESTKDYTDHVLHKTIPAGTYQIIKINP